MTEVIFGISGFILGTILGSFVKAVADRSLIGRAFSGRSYCPSCKKSLKWYDLIPILSFLFLWGKCRYCGNRIGLEYPVVEIAMGILVGFLFWQESISFQFSVFSFQKILNYPFLSFLVNLVLKTFFITVLVSLFLTDLKKMFIPDRIIIPSIVIGAISGLLLTFFKIGYLYFYLSQNTIGKYLIPPYSDYFRRHAVGISEPFLYSVVTGVLIAGFFLSLIVITKGKGMGGGDVKLGGFMGLMLGVPNAILALFLAFLIGAVWAVGAIVLGKKSLKQTIAFGPFLVLGSLIALFWGTQILGWYLTIN